MCLQLIFSCKCNIALDLALVIWTCMVCCLEMTLQRLIIIIVGVLMIITTKMTRQMESTQMIKELLVIKEVLLTKLTPWMRQDFSSSFCPSITMIKMISQLLCVVYSLLPDEDSSSFETNLAESFLMVTFHMLS